MVRNRIASEVAPSGWRGLRYRADLRGALVAALVAFGTVPVVDAGAASPPAVSPGAAAFAEARLAIESYNAKDWEGAVRHYEKAVSVNRSRGSHLDLYAYSLHHVGRDEEAIEIWMECARLGHRRADCYFNCACADAALGRVDRAFDHLRTAIEHGYWDETAFAEDADLAPLRADARFAEITGVGLAPVGSRSERWRRDILFLRDRIVATHWSPFAIVDRAQYLDSFNTLAASAESLSDDAILVELRRLLAELGAGHTLLGVDAGAVLEDPLTGLSAAGHAGASSPRLPIAIAVAEGGYYVVRASSASADILGARLTRVGGIPIDDAVARLAPFRSVDNAMGELLWNAWLLGCPEVLRVTGLADSAGVVEFAGDRDGRPVHARISALATEGHASEWVSVEPQRDALAPTLRDRNRPYWFATLDEPPLVYLQFNQTRDDPAEPFADFCARVLAAASSDASEGLIIDLRNNPGGNKALFGALVDGIARSERLNRRDHLFVLIGRRTFSAAMCGAAELEARTNALFVGEPTGSRPNFVGESSPVTLPYSRVRVSISSRYHQNTESTDTRTWIGPHIAAPPTMEAWESGTDPAIDAIRAHVAASRR
ncbi:MAG: TPR end-of-group domain-containing protein [bacterium]